MYEMSLLCDCDCGATVYTGHEPFMKVDLLSTTGNFASIVLPVFTDTYFSHLPSGFHSPHPRWKQCLKLQVLYWIQLGFEITWMIIFRVHQLAIVCTFIAMKFSINFSWFTQWTCSLFVMPLHIPRFMIVFPWWPLIVFPWWPLRAVYRGFFYGWVGSCLICIGSLLKWGFAILGNPWLRADPVQTP